MTKLIMEAADVVKIETLQKKIKDLTLYTHDDPNPNGKGTVGERRIRIRGQINKIREKYQKPTITH